VLVVCCSAGLSERERLWKRLLRFGGGVFERYLHIYATHTIIIKKTAHCFETKFILLALNLTRFCAGPSCNDAMLIVMLQYTTVTRDVPDIWLYLDLAGYPATFHYPDPYMVLQSQNTG